MIGKAILIVTVIVCLISSELVVAQTNYFEGPNHLNTNLTQEYQNRIYYLTSKFDTSATGLNQYQYHLVCINKNTGIKIGQYILPIDSEVYESQRNGLVEYLVDSQTNRVHIMFSRVLDSSLYYTSKSAAFPEVLNYTQTDLDLNTTVQEKPLFVNGKDKNFRLYSFGFLNRIRNDRLVLQFSVVDSILLYSGSAFSMATKLAICDLNGNLLENKFLGWQPSYYNQSNFYSHFSVRWLLPESDSNYRICAQFEDIPNSNITYIHWLFLDENLDLQSFVDTARYPQSKFSKANGPGTKLQVFGGGSVECQTIIPSGKIFRLGLGQFFDSSANKSYWGPAVARVIPQDAYKIDTFYVVPQSYDNWNCPGYGSAKQPMVYNPFDHQIYVYNVTHGSTPPGTGCGGPGEDAIGQLVCLDTNLVEQWVKYIPWKMGGTCMFPSGLGLPYQRSGVLITGTEVDKNDRFNQSKWRSYIYYSDQTGQLKIQDRGSPEGQLLDRFSLYPNPAKDNLTIRNMRPEDYQYSIINYLGQKIMTSNAGAEKNHTVDIGSLPSGMYLLRVFPKNGKMKSLKFIKN